MNKLQCHFNRIANNYDQIAFVSQYMQQQLLLRLKELDIQPKKILDLGCGTGAMLEHLQKTHANAEIIGVDFSESMLAIAKQRCPNASFALQDINKLVLPEHQYDLIILNNVLQWVDIGTVFARIKLLLAEQGVVLFSTVGPNTLIELKQIWKAVAHKASINNFIDMHDIGDVLRELHFVDPVLESKNLHYQFDDVLSLLYTLKAMGSVSLQDSQYLTKTILQKLQDRYPVTDQQKVVTCEVIFGIAKQAKNLQTATVNHQGEIRIPISQLKLKK